MRFRGGALLKYSGCWGIPTVKKKLWRNSGACTVKQRHARSPPDQSCFLRTRSLTSRSIRQTSNNGEPSLQGDSRYGKAIQREFIRRQRNLFRWVEFGGLINIFHLASAAAG